MRVLYITGTIATGTASIYASSSLLGDHCNGDCEYIYEFFTSRGPLQRGLRIYMRVLYLLLIIATGTASKYVSSSLHGDHCNGDCEYICEYFTSPGLLQRGLRIYMFGIFK